MEAIIVLFAILILSLVYWFRWWILRSSHKDIMIWTLWFLGWIFSASLLLYLLNHWNLWEIYYYQAIIWPILEELAKFLVIFYIYISFKESFKSYKWLAIVWVLVWLWFWIYENIIYIWSWIDDFYTILYRSIFVWWLILHPLTAWIFWYMIWVSSKLWNWMPNIFKTTKQEFCWVMWIYYLAKHIYIQTKYSIKNVLIFIKRVLVLDVTINHLIWNKKSSTYWHWPTEVIYEWLLLWIWIHILYNSILVHMWEQYLIVAIISILITLLLTNLFIKLFHSKIFWFTVSFIIILWFVLTNYEIWQAALNLSLFTLVVVLLLFSWEINQRINSINNWKK